jgi:hypothetical protein
VEFHATVVGGGREGVAGGDGAGRHSRRRAAVRLGGGGVAAEARTMSTGTLNMDRSPDPRTREVDP